MVYPPPAMPRSSSSAARAIETRSSGGKIAIKTLMVEQTREAPP